MLIPQIPVSIADYRDACFSLEIYLVEPHWYRLDLRCCCWRR